MTAPHIIDAGPALNFFATKNERLLLHVVEGFLLSPETVSAEVQRKSQNDARFSAASAVWAKLARAGRLTELSDDVTPELSAATQRITGLPLAQRRQRARDLGEVMVVAHAAVLAEAGNRVTVLIDDGGGASLAARESARLDRLRLKRPEYGSLSLANTESVLAAAAGGPHLPDRASMRRTYEALRRCDDGLVDISRTNLLDKRLWGS